MNTAVALAAIAGAIVALLAATGGLAVNAMRMGRFTGRVTTLLEVHDRELKESKDSHELLRGRVDELEREWIPRAQRGTDRAPA